MGGWKCAREEKSPVTMQCYFYFFSVAPQQRSFRDTAAVGMRCIPSLTCISGGICICILRQVWKISLSPSGFIDQRQFNGPTLNIELTSD